MLWYCINANVFFYASCVSPSVEDTKLPYTDVSGTTYGPCHHFMLPGRLCFLLSTQLQDVQVDCQFFCWPLTACQSLYHVLLPPICSSPLSYLSGVHPFVCRACLQIPCTGPHRGLCLCSQQSDIYPPTSLNHLKIDPEHPKADT